MPKNSSQPKFWEKYEREDAARYLLITLISLALTVALVRLFLNLSNYPQIGGGDLHISHVLWGGLLLFIAALTLLVVDHRLVYYGSSVLSGVGFGLFVDEVGKFITKDYNYFFPAAAPIIYITILLTLYAYLRVRRPNRREVLNGLLQALKLIEDDLEAPLSSQNWEELKVRLASVVAETPTESQAHLARQLLDYVQAESRPVPEKVKPSWWQRFAAKTTRWLNEGRLRALLVAGLVLLGLLAWKNPVEIAPWTPPVLAAFLHSARLGGEVPAQSAPWLFTVRVVLEAVVGFLFLVSAGLLALKRINYAVGLGYLAFLITLLALDIAIFYFEQFSAILTVTFQFLVLFGLLEHRRRFPVSLKDSPPYLRAFIEWIERSLTLRPRKMRLSKRTN